MSSQGSQITTCRVDGSEVAVAAVLCESADARRHAERRATGAGQVSVYTVERAGGQELLVVVGSERSVKGALSEIRELGATVALSDLQTSAIARRWLSTLRTVRRRGDNQLREAIRWPRRTGGDQ